MLHTNRHSRVRAISYRPTTVMTSFHPPKFPISIFIHSKLNISFKSYNLSIKRWDWLSFLFFLLPLLSQRNIKISNFFFSFSIKQSFFNERFLIHPVFSYWRDFDIFDKAAINQGLKRNYKTNLSMFLIFDISILAFKKRKKFERHSIIFNVTRQFSKNK